MSFPRYPEYQDAGVEWLGAVPAHWDSKRLRFVADFNPSKSEIAELDPATDVSFLPMEAIGDDGSLNLERTRPIAEVETGYTFFGEGDVTVAKITPCFENGKGAVMRGLTLGVGFGTTELIVARPKERETTSDFLHWLFISIPFRKLGEAAMYGAGGQKRVPDEFVRNFKTAFPTVAEQKVIATFLDHETAKIDALVAEQEKLIALLKEKRQAVISHAVTKGLNPDAPMKDSGIEWLGEVPAHWDVMRLGMVSSVVRGASPRPAGDPKFFSGNAVPWITVAEITKDGDVYLTGTSEFLTVEGAECSRKFQAGTLIYSNSGATLGVPKILAIDGCANDGVVGFERLSESVAIRFLYHFLASITDSIRDRVKQGSGQPNLNTDIVKAISFPLPLLDEQIAIDSRISAVTSDFRELTAEAEHAIALLQERRSALISAAVTGKIDVREFA
jgi:type I restriction enzyme, S subunit